MQTSPIPLIICAALGLAACGSKSPQAKAPVDTAAIVGAIKADEVHWNNDYKSGDAGVLAGHYAPNATLMVPGLPPMVGTAAIKAGLTQALADKAFALSFESDKVDVSASGDLAAAHGVYTESATDPATKAAVTEKGSYVTVYKPQADGAWKAVWDINTPGAPQAPSSEAK
jgi:uncharacterized protein (TIGR02246 family)